MMKFLSLSNLKLYSLYALDKFIYFSKLLILSFKEIIICSKSINASKSKVPVSLEKLVSSDIRKILIKKIVCIKCLLED